MIIPPKEWEIYLDDASRSPRGKEKRMCKITLLESIFYLFPYMMHNPYSFFLTKGCSNNTAEYEAVITGLESQLQMAIANLTIYGNSELIVKQLTTEYNVKKAELSPIIKERKFCSHNFTK